MPTYTCHCETCDDDFDDLVELVVFDQQIDDLHPMIRRLAVFHPTVRRAVFGEEAERSEPHSIICAGVPVTTIHFPLSGDHLEYAMKHGERW